jgi:photosystem II stability/assembly factor-like uncharacterized protein
MKLNNSLIRFIFACICLSQAYCKAEEITPPPSPIRDFIVSNEGEAWIVTSKGKIFHLFNGGQGNEPINLDVTARQIYFLNTGEGWILDSNGQIWASTNNGKDWVKRGKFKKDPTSGSGQITFVNNQIGWLVGNYALWLTEDGGNSWIQVLPSEKFSYETIEGQPMTYFPVNENIGWLGMTNSRVFRTTDRGRNWEEVNIPEHSSIYSLYAVDENECFIPAFEGTGIYHTTEGGKNWKQILKDVDKKMIGIFSVSFPTRELGWAIGMKFQTNPSSPDKLNGVVLKTIDGGKTWNKEKSDFYKNPFRIVKFTDEQNGWLASKDSIYKTNNGGGDWQKVFQVDSIEEKKSNSP